MTHMKNTVLPYYGVAALWLLIAVLQRLDQFPLAMALSVGVFVLLRIDTQRGEPHPPRRKSPALETRPPNLRK